MTEREAMREEVKALREEVARLRAELAARPATVVIQQPPTIIRTPWHPQPYWNPPIYVTCGDTTSSQGGSLYTSTAVN